jgi:hypothetical protein
MGIFLCVGPVGRDTLTVHRRADGRDGRSTYSTTQMHAPGYAGPGNHSTAMRGRTDGRMTPTGREAGAVSYGRPDIPTLRPPGWAPVRIDTAVIDAVS